MPATSAWRFDMSRHVSILTVLAVLAVALNIILPILRYGATNIYSTGGEMTLALAILAGVYIERRNKWK